MRPDRWVENPMGLVVPSSAYERRRYDRPVGVDLFSGCGGFSLGMHQAGFHVAAAVELEMNAATTYLVNLARPGVKLHFDTPEREEKYHRHLEDHLGIRPKKGRKKDQVFSSGQGLLAGDGWISGQPADEPGCEHFWIADVKTLTGAEILDALDMEPGDVDCVFGGPPCQGFSVAGKRNVVDPRNSLVFEFARLVLEIRPKAMVMENVLGIASMTTPEGVPVLDALALILAEGGFGAYEALRKSLAATAGLGAAVRGTKSAKEMRRPKDEPDEDLDDDGLDDEPATEQLVLA